MPVKINYLVGGRKVSKDEWAESIEQKAMQLVLDRFETEFARLHCDEHDRGPTVAAQREESGFRLQIGGCCDALKARTEECLRKLGARQAE